MPPSLPGQRRTHPIARKDQFTKVEGLKARYIEEGKGPAVLLLHGASLGSSADVWERNLSPLADAGLRVIAYDQPGFGLTDNPFDYSVTYRRDFILSFMDALGLQQAGLVGHSQPGNMAVALAFNQTKRVSKVVVLGTGSLLPPLPEAEKQQGAREGEEGTATEPTLSETRALLEHNLFNHDLITQEVLDVRHGMSLGKNFQAFLQRGQVARPGGGKSMPPIWQRLAELPVPLLLVFGKNDRASAGARAALLKERYPGLNLHIVDRCKHLVQWDAGSEFNSLSTKFLTS